MFIRKTIKTDRKTGIEYISYQLVEAFRSELGQRQKILLTIGSDLDLNSSDRKNLAIYKALRLGLKPIKTEKTIVKSKM